MGLWPVATGIVHLIQKKLSTNKSCEKCYPDVLSVVYLDQLSGAACTQKLTELLFFSRFQAFLML